MRSKILSVILSVCMVLTLMPTVAFAVDTDTSIEISTVEVKNITPAGITVQATTGSAISGTTASAIVLSGEIDESKISADGVEVEIEANYRVKTSETLGDATTASGIVVITSKTNDDGTKTPEITDKGKAGNNKITFTNEDGDTFVAGVQSILTIPPTTPVEETYTVSGTVSRDSYVNTEVALSGISVKLYSVADGVETLFKTVTTGTNGAYQFTEIPNGSYIAKIDAVEGSYREVQRSITVKDGNVTNANIVLLAPSNKSYNINLTVEDETRGNVEIGGATDNKATSGTAITVTATPNQGYELASITVINDKNGTVTVSSERECGFTMPASDVNITVVFKEAKTQKESFVITREVAPNNTGEITVKVDDTSIPAEGKVEEGQLVEITVSPKADYNVSSVTVTNTETYAVLVLSKNEGNKYTFIMPDAPVTIVAVLSEDNIQVEAGATEVDDDAVKNMPVGPDKTLAEAVVNEVGSATSTGLDKAVTDALKTSDGNLNVNVSPSEMQIAKEKLGLSEDSQQEVLIVVEPYLDIKVDGAKADEENPIVTLNIKAMYNTKATTADNAAKMDANNSTTIGNPKPLTVVTPIEITVPLPDSIINSMDAALTYFARHITSANKTVYHKLTKNSNGVKFINDKGFSKFELPVEGTTVKYDNGVGDSAVTSEDIGKDLPVPNVEDGKTFNGWKFYTNEDKTTIVSGTVGPYKTLTQEVFDALNAALTGDVTKIYAFADTTYNGGSSSGGGGGGGGSSATTYTVTVPSSIDHGKVTVSPRNASKGNTVTITATPDEGYKVGTITVKDKDGKEIEVKDAGDNKYTFVMPASKVDISATFVEDDGKEPTDPTDPTEPTTVTYSDVAATAWYYDAVNYVTTNGLMNGVGNDRFAPNSNLTRAMFAQILYNKEGKPAAGTSTFSDVAAGQWYTDAISWAAANGVVNGIGNNMFGPNNNITREQLAVMLYRYAGSPAVTGSVTGFNDAGQISSYATTAMAWATTNGVMNGKGDGRLDPKGLATRAEVAQMMQNYFK